VGDRPEAIGPMSNEPGEATRAARFRRAYTAHREREGRAVGVAELLALPYAKRGRWTAQWRVRARTYEHFMRTVVERLERAAPSRPLRVLDLGAGNGWLCYRLHLRGHSAVALDWRWDEIDGLGAARGYRGYVEPLFERVAGSFEALPFPDSMFDLTVFNASIHYATDLAAAIAGAVRVLVPTGSVVILDSPFYRRAADGEAMVVEKRAGGALDLGPDRDDLLALPSVEFLTRQHLEQASAGLELSWRRHRVLYPLAYELRPLWAALRGRRSPSRFDVWEGRRSPLGPRGAR
jgi:SAM-dependent methyltransferase